jgi:hypothetical protein
MSERSNRRGKALAVGYFQFYFNFSDQAAMLSGKR